MSQLEYVDRSDAPDDQFAPLLARLESAEPVDAGQDARVETVARAIHQEQNRGAHWELTFERVRDEYRRLATAALRQIEATE